MEAISLPIFKTELGALDLPDLPALPSPFSHASLPSAPPTARDAVLESFLLRSKQVPFTCVTKRELGALVDSDSDTRQVLALPESPSTVEDDDSGSELQLESQRLGARTWDVWYRDAAEQIGESSTARSHKLAPGPLRLLSDHVASSKTDVSVLEALTLQMEGFPNIEGSTDQAAATAGPASKYITPRPAPTHSLAEVLDSLLVTATEATSNDLFRWDHKRGTYRWSGAMQQQVRAEQYFARVKSILKGKSRSIEAGLDDETEDNETGDLPSFEEWWGSERIVGATSAASESVLSRLLEIGTMIRRGMERTNALRELCGSSAATEVGAVCVAVDVELQYAQDMLRRWRSTFDRPSSLLRLNKQVTGIHEVLSALMRLLGCSLPSRPPYKTPFNLLEPSSILTHVYSHYVASVSSYQSMFVQKSLLWILDKVSCAWRIDLAAWIGWPGAVSSNSSAEIGEDALITSSSYDSSTKTKPRRMEPWAGARVEWSLDERGEEDVGYTLLPSKLPAFVSIAKARVLLEAGRALRLLKKAATPDHPLLKQLESNAGASLEPDRGDLPSWLTSAEMQEIRQRQLATRVKDLQHGIAAWRKGKADANEGRRVQQPSLPTTTPINTTVEAADPLSRDFNRLFARLDEAPKSEPASESKDVVEYRRWIADVAPTLVSSSSATGPIATVPERPAQKLLEPLLQWSKLVNAALISVFFRDLGFPAYLRTCRQFLLLGSHHFSEAIQELLFSDGLEPSDRQGTSERLVRTNQAAPKAPGEGLSKLLASSVWPPPAGQFAPRFNAAVLEAVGYMRDGADFRTGESGGGGRTSSSTTRDALRDLDDRLSFALVDPSISRIRGTHHSRWQDPQSIDGIDWLTLSFNPPSLIAPLLTQHAQLSYQRILNFLLRLLRVKTVLRGLHLRIVRHHRSSGGGMVLLPGEATPLYAFSSLMQHFISSLGAHVEQNAIGQIWKQFEERLDQLQRDAETQDEEFVEAAETDAEEEMDGDEEGKTRRGKSMADLSEAAPIYAAHQAQAGTSNSSSLRLKDVFSIARYHERVLDRIISACFQKQRQVALGSLVDELFDLILQFSATMKRCEEEEVGEERQEGRRKMLTVAKRFESRLALLVRGLRIVEQSGRRSAASATRHNQAQGPSSKQDRAAPSSRAHDKQNSHRQQQQPNEGHHRRQSSTAAATLNPVSAASAGEPPELDASTMAEMIKQEAEADEDLRLLEMKVGKGLTSTTSGGSRAAYSSSESELAAQLLARLDLMGMYA